MDSRYEAYCFANPFFYDVPSQDGPEAAGFLAELPSPPDDWDVTTRDVWQVLRPSGTSMAAQGWKIHVSATLANARHVLVVVYQHCLTTGTPLKFLRTEDILLARNSKYAARESSGKFVTVYPPDERSLRDTVTTLNDLLRGQAGPFVLSDLRYEAGPLYLRYGGFLEQWVTGDDGEPVTAIARPDGTLVPDLRRPVFHTPDWVEVPPFLRPQLAARKARAGGEQPFIIERPLHFSNGGGVYRAVRVSDGRPAILKEARPHAGLDRDRRDAVARLDQEHQALSALDGVTGIPAVLGRFRYWEHEFLALSVQPGIPLGQWLARHYPLSRPRSTPGERADFTERAFRILDQVEALLHRVHDLGYVYGDLHDRNILVDENDQVSLVDFELARPSAEATRSALGAPGFAAPPDRVGVDADLYAAAVLRLWMFLPMTALTALDPGKAETFVRFAIRAFPLSSADFGDAVLGQLRPRTPATTPADAPPPSAGLRALATDRPDWASVRESVATAVLRSATPHRRDRLFPGDIEQFRGGGATLAHGAAGVLHALAAADHGRHPHHETWLADSVRRDPPRRPGLYDGAHGIAHVLEELGRHELADELLTEFDPLLPHLTRHGLGSGLAGIALNLLHFGARRADPGRTDQALVLGERLLAAVPPPAAAGPRGKGRAGLLHGWSGPALLFLRLFELTGERRWLTAADDALAADIAECGETEHGALLVRDGSTRMLPYLEVGSAGIVVVLEQLAGHAPDSPTAGQLPGLRRALLGEFAIQPGLFLGRAGLMVALAAGVRRDQDPKLVAALRRHRARLALHAIPHEGEVAFPGNQLLRLSMDLATGGAGVLLALAAVEGDLHLPLLHPGASSSGSGEPTGRQDSAAATQNPRP
ncbi:class III lanthionine synthetase LanKC [Actinoalloteichus caeruleus]|uniref:class III lanthionine synthetase LanKC n=2 Tax=Actinoalloteichus cyanogriseus TaxID=2893586 RepID=UPI0005BBAE75|nr:class III lanthionine synthetase LanKC [Actinoalloteichus caeruleus]